MLPPLQVKRTWLNLAKCQVENKLIGKVWHDPGQSETGHVEDYRRNHHSPTNGPSGEFMYVTAKNIKPEGLVTDNITYISADTHEEVYRRCNPELGDILYIKDGATTGVVTINNLTSPFSMLSSVALLKRPPEIEARYLLYALRSPFFYELMRGDMSGVAITRITLAKLEKALLPLPSLFEQRRIVAKVEELMAICDELESPQKKKRETRERLVASALDKLTSALDAAEFDTQWHRLRDHFDLLFDHPSTIPPLREAILHLAVRGKLVPQDPKDEPASKLIKSVMQEKGRLVSSNLIKGVPVLEPIRNSEVLFPIPSSWEWVRAGDVCWPMGPIRKAAPLSISGAAPFAPIRRVPMRLAHGAALLGTL